MYTSGQSIKSLIVSYGFLPFIKTTSLGFGGSSLVTLSFEFTSTLDGGTLLFSLLHPNKKQNGIAFKITLSLMSDMVAPTNKYMILVLYLDSNMLWFKEKGQWRCQTSERNCVS